MPLCAEGARIGKQLNSKKCEFDFFSEFYGATLKPEGMFHVLLESPSQLAKDAFPGASICPDFW